MIMINPAIDRRAFLSIAALAGSAALIPPAVAQSFDAYPAPDRELMVPVEGGRIYVRVNGDLKAPRAPLLMIHGGPGGTHSALIDALGLADERAVILYDQLDSGRSDHPEDPANWRVDRFVDEVGAIAAALGVRRWHVCGHSWGGTIALEYGARRPAALAGLVLASPLISTKRWLQDADVLVKRLPSETQATIAGCDSPAPPPAEACQAATDLFYARFNRREPPSAMLRAYSAHGGRGFNATLYRTMWGASEFVSTGTLRDYDGEPLLDRLDGRRTLFIVGQHDEVRPATAERFALRVPDAELAMVPGAAHGIFSDRPALTLGLLRPWLRQRDAI